MSMQKEKDLVLTRSFFDQLSGLRQSSFFLEVVWSHTGFFSRICEGKKAFFDKTSKSINDAFG